MNGPKFRTTYFILISGVFLMLIVVGVAWWHSIGAWKIWYFCRILIKDFGLLGLLLIGAFGFGSLVIHSIGFRNRSQPGFYLYSISLGLGIIGHLLLGLGALGGYFKPVGWILLLVGLAIALVEISRMRVEYRQVLAQIKLPKYINLFSILLVLLLAANLLYPLFSDALVPPVSWDEVAYHLAIPKIYIEHHSISYIPFIPYSNWPLETEMLFTLSLLLASETLAHLISWTTLLLTCAGLFIFSRKHINSQMGLLAAVIFSSTPMVTTLAGTALIELPLTLYIFLAAITFLEWIISKNQKYWVLSAIFGGLAASTKLNAALVPFLLGIVMTIILLRQKTPFILVFRQFLYYGLVAGAIVSPWFLKTWFFTNNPFWPFFYPILGGRNWDALGTEYLLGFIRSPNLRLTPLNWIRGLWLLTTEPAKFGPYRVTIGQQYLALLPYSVPALLFWRYRFRRLLQWLAVLGVIFYTSWFFQTHQTRFLMPTMAIMALLASAGVFWLLQTEPNEWKHWSNFVIIGLTPFLVVNSWLVNPTDRNHVISRWPYLSGQITRDQFLESQVPGYDTYLYANQHLPQDAFVWLALYESRGYYLDRDYMWANPISQRAFPLEGFSNADQLASELASRGFTYVIFRSTNLEKFTYIKYGKKITELTQQLLANHADRLYGSSELELYELRP
jgi:4-amino-4-deoxy-L-arabinose transferase-like glycosyltransferase